MSDIAASIETPHQPRAIDLDALRRIRIVFVSVKLDDGLRPTSEQQKRAGFLDINMQAQRAYWRGHRVDLTHAEFRVVCLLAFAGRDVSHREIYDVIRRPGFLAGDGDNGYMANVRTMIKRIRQAFDAIDPKFDAIRTYSGFGYGWSAGDVR